MIGRSLRIAVRPRGILECLDLAVLVCGRHLLGVAAAVAVGAVPVILFNRLVFGATEDPQALPFVILLTALEMPWAAAPLTMFLGTTVFTGRVTPAVWREWIRGGIGAAGPMLLFQGVLRSMAIVSCVCVLGPFFVLAAYYLGPVVLLERGGIAGIVSRSIGLVRHDPARILAFLLIDGVLLGGGWLAGCMFLDSIVSLWSGGTIVEALAAALDSLAFGPDDFSPAAAFASWPSQIAFWAAAAVVTAFRFFTYLDTRIRHEGWDVELMLRDPDTYAGLGRRSGLVVMLLLAAFIGGADRTACASQADSAAADGAVVQDAMVKQRFPWYDEATDGYRPMIRVEPEPRWSVDPTVLGEVIRVVLIAALVAAVAGVVWMLVRHGLGPGAEAAAVPARKQAALGREAIEALPDAVRRHDGDLLAEAERLAGLGDFAGAMVLFHGWQLVQLHGRGVIELSRGKTNGRYAAEVAASAPRMTGLFRRSCRLFEDVLFGRLPVEPAAFAEVWQCRGDFVAARSMEAVS